MKNKTDYWIEKAKKWYTEHKEHVDRLHNSTNYSYPPTESLDIDNPNLWKGAHWRWFLDNLI